MIVMIIASRQDEEDEEDEGDEGDEEDEGDEGVREVKKQLIKSHEDLAVYRLAFDAAMRIFELSKKFPVEERYSLTDQIRRSSRSVCANLAEAWRKRRYEAAFVAKLSDCVRGACRRQAEAAETQTWITFAVKCQYLEIVAGREVYATYNQIISGLVHMINSSSNWTIK